jgi:hypothetical protein
VTVGVRDVSKKHRRDNWLRSDRGREKGGGRARLLRGKEIIHNMDINKMLMKQKNSMKLG